METIIHAAPPWKEADWVESYSWSTFKFPDVSYVSEWETETETPIIKIKKQIENLDKEHRWELAKKMVNPYELVYTHNDERLPPSLSIVSPLSRSFFKMVEILDVLQFFKAVPTKITSAHIARFRRYRDNRYGH